MSKRGSVNPSKDKSIFTKTASSVKSVNLPIVNFRGGVRF